jgi:hypothetical protein
MTARRTGITPLLRWVMAGALVLWASPLLAQPYAIPRHIIAGGGGTSTSPLYTLSGVIGGVGAGVMSGGTFTVTGGFWSMPLGEAGPFTDEPLMAGASMVRAVHITELRNRVNAQRLRFGLGAASWTDPALGAGGMIKAQHVSELRVAMQEAYTQAGVSFPSLQDPVLAPGTPVRAVHLSQLRVVVKNLEEQ